MITTKIILDSISNAGARIITYELKYPRFVHSELMTHREFTRNASSCLTGDTLITIIMPSNKVHKMQLKDIARKWFDGDTLGRTMKGRIKSLNLRCLNEETGEFTTTKITNCFRQGIQKIYKINLEDGKFLKCTENHKIYTDEGWKTLKNFGVKFSSGGFIYYDSNLPLIATNGFIMTREWLLKEKDLGKTLKKISEENNINYKTLCSFSEKERIFFQKKQLLNETFEFKNKDWLEQKLKEGLFSTDIAKICNTTYDRVKKQIKKFKLKGNKWTWGKKTTWNKGKTYKLPDSSLIKVREAANRRRKPDSYKKYKEFNISITRFLTEIRKEIMDKYNYTCQVSGTNQWLQLHHITPVWYDKSKAFDKDNIIPLTKDVHKYIHSKNLDLEFMNYYHENKDLKKFIELHEDLKIKCEEIFKPRGTRKLIARYVKISNIEYIGEEETYDLEVDGPYKNFIANQIIVHNSRAIPIEKMIDKIKEDPALVIYWGKNQSGMQARQELDEKSSKLCEIIWNTACKTMIGFVELLSKIGLHKQIANRLLEPFMNITVICTATNWSNFFALRCDETAQPEIRRLAFCMLRDYYNSTPKVLNMGEWHLPYLTEEENKLPLELKQKISVAKSARVSYLTHAGDRDYNKDLELYERLLKDGHMSPFEHVATPSLDLTTRSGNFTGWRQYRKIIGNDIRMEIPTIEEVEAYFKSL